MRRPFLPVVLLLGACSADAPLGVAPPAAEEPTLLAAASAPPAPKLVICRRGYVSLGPLYIVDGRLVLGRAGAEAAALPGARVDTLAAEAAVARYGSRANEGVYIVTLAAAAEPAPSR